MSAAAAMKQMSHTFSQARFPSLNVRHFTFTRNFVMGGAIYYAIENEYYSHLPLALFVPSPYAGYQVYKNFREHTKSHPPCGKGACPMHWTAKQAPELK